MTPLPAFADPRHRKLAFRASRRGFVEADLVIGGFVRDHVETLAPAELDALEALLETPDHQLYGWIVGREPAPPAQDSPLLRRMQAYGRAGLTRAPG